MRTANRPALIRTVYIQRHYSDTGRYSLVTIYVYTINFQKKILIAK